MPDQLQQATIGSRVNQYRENHGFADSKAFLYLAIEKFLKSENINNDEIDIEESIVDGSHDKGIDAIVIVDSDVDRPKVIVFQSKYYTRPNAHESFFEGNAVEKLKSAVNDYIRQNTKPKEMLNERLFDRLRSVHNLLPKNPEIHFVFTSNSLPPIQTERDAFIDFIRKVNDESGNEYLFAHFFHIDQLAPLLAPKLSKKVNDKLQITGKFIDHDGGDVRLLIGLVDATEFTRLFGEHAETLFDQNVRGFLKRSNPVNKKIINTATHEKSRPRFLYMNNGVTITCSKFSRGPASQSPMVELEELQIVNGQQTVRSINEALQSGSDLEGVQILTRIVETQDEDLLSKIIEATNTQSKVTSRDLHSNDQIQKYLEEQLRDLGYFYEARKAKYQGKEISRRVDAEKAAQYYSSAIFENPALAKDKKGELFGEDYEKIFNEQLDAKDFLRVFLLGETVTKLNEDNVFATSYSFLKDAKLTTVALIYRNIRLGSIEPSDINGKNAIIVDAFKRAVHSTGVYVAELFKKEGDKYEHRRTFKDPETYGRIVEIMEKNGK